MHKAVNPLTPSLDLSTFDSAYILMPIEVKDIQENDNVVLLDKESNIMQVNGEKLLHVLSAKKTEEDDPEVCLTVVPFVPYHTAHHPVLPPFNEPIMDYENISTLALTMVKFNQEDYPDLDVSTSTDLYKVTGIEVTQLIRECSVTVDDFDTVSDKNALKRFPLKVYYRSEIRQTLSTDPYYTVQVNVITTPYMVPYFQKLVEDGQLFYDVRK